MMETILWGGCGTAQCMQAWAQGWFMILVFVVLVTIGVLFILGMLEIASLRRRRY